VQAFAQASGDFFAAVADYNRAQFRLYRALGHPAHCLAHAIPEPESAPAVPPVPDEKPTPLPPLPVIPKVEAPPVPVRPVSSVQPAVGVVPSVGPLEPLTTSEPEWGPARSVSVRPPTSPLPRP
jgi:hypothetical protein